MSRWAVRAAKEEDFGQIRELGYRLAEGAAPWRPEEAFAQAARGWLDESIRAMDTDHPVWVAEQDDRVVGVVSACIRQHFTGQDDCYLGELVVSPTAEGRGIGRQLVAAVEAWAVERDVRRVTLETGAANHRARGFYAELGYLDEQVQLTRVLSARDGDS